MDTFEIWKGPLFGNQRSRPEIVWSLQGVQLVAQLAARLAFDFKLFVSTSDPTAELSTKLAVLRGRSGRVR